MQKDSLRTYNIEHTNIDPHPDYDDVKYPNDLSIIKLDRCVKFNKYITTIPQLADDGMDFINKPCYVTGWGVYDRNVFRLADILQEAKVPVITNAQCQPGILKNITITEDMICTEDNIRGGCFSDSGGPLQCLINQKWVHVGTVSWGNPSCNGLTVYARTSYFRDWILWTMEKISKSN
ncbi:chymotrypsin-like elastase family member 1 [Argopecten irradians]|uniref:chymotrypsin-like elastase family member 1 n=1 Tax=Argopecten irradians TaxID=31199 RepID=UPI0037144727